MVSPLSGDGTAAENQSKVTPQLLRRICLTLQSRNCFVQTDDIGGRHGGGDDVKDAMVSPLSRDGMAT